MPKLEQPDAKHASGCSLMGEVKMKKILIFCVCILLSNNLEHTNPKHFDTELPKFISTTYKVPLKEAQRAVYYATIKTTDNFPTKTDVLAIMSIESGFKHKSVSGKGAKGWMQIKYRKTISESDNIDAGIHLLKNYLELFKTEKAAIMAYNLGSGNYKKGKRNMRFYKKYLAEKKKLESI
jgi:hypothetical protein